jgi:hypothetical protein
MNRTLQCFRRLLLVTLFAGSGMLGASGVAAAQYADSPPGNGPSADPGVTSSNRANSDSSARISQSSGSSLPITGGDVVGLAVAGTGAVALGAVLVTIRRRSLRV